VPDVRSGDLERPVTAYPYPPREPGHWVHVRLPDGRDAVARHDDPIVPVMRRILKATGMSHTDADPRDVAAVARWLDINGVPVQLELDLGAVA
jgi:hypothetical protein